METNLWAIGMKGWVEIRRSAKPPNLHKSETEIDAVRVKNSFIIDNYGYYRHKIDKIPYKKKFSVIYYAGGKAVATIKDRRFAALTHVKVQPGGMIQLTQDMIEVLKEKELI